MGPIARSAAFDPETAPGGGLHCQYLHPVLDIWVCQAVCGKESASRTSVVRGGPPGAQFSFGCGASPQTFKHSTAVAPPIYRSSIGVRVSKHGPVKRRTYR